MKTEATSKQILNSCDNIKDSPGKDDIIILATGSNDKNPYILLSELGTALYKLRDFNVFVVNVLHNPYLNVALLN